MIFYNIMTCQAPIHGVWKNGLMGSCSQAWLVLGLLFILVMVLKRQCEDGILQGTGFNVFGAGGLGLIAAIVLTTLFGQPRWEFIGGIAGIILGGFGLGLIGLGNDGSG
jgi:hypothetical protein